MCVSTFLGFFLHRNKSFINVLDKEGDVKKLFSIICVPPSPKFSSTNEASLKVDKDKLCPASIFSHLFESDGFIINCIVENKVAFFIIHALWESLN